MSLLNEIQQKLKVPKSQYNKFSEFYYRNAEDIMEAVKPLLGGKGTLVLSDEIVLIGDRYYVKATAHLSDGDGAVWFAYGWARETAERPKFDGAQLTGAASSYARKYALNGLFCIDDTKDADNHDNTSQTAQKPLGATKPAKKEYRLPEKKGLGTELVAAADRIILQLDTLDVPRSTREERVQSVKELTGLDVVHTDLNAMQRIGDRLEALIEERNNAK